MTNTATQTNQPRGSGLRMGLGLPLAAVVTAGLFLAMGAMIKAQDIELAAEAPTPKFDFIREKPQPPETRTVIDEPTVPTETPPEPVVDWPTESRTDVIPTGPIDRPVPTNPGDGTVSLPGLRGAILQYQPTYPDRCATRGIEGSVLVEFDVTALGAVVNERIVRSSDSCFDRAAIDAIRRWKFSPNNSVGANSIVQYGLRKEFVFRLQG